MPGTNIMLTGAPVRITATGSQELRLVRDVSAFDELDLELRVLVVEGTGNLDISLETAMQNEDDSLGWVGLEEFSRVTASNTSETKNVKNFLRFVRWKVNVFTATSATFGICGVGRSWSSAGAVGKLPSVRADLAVAAHCAGPAHPLDSPRVVRFPPTRLGPAPATSALTSPAGRGQDV